MTAAVLVLAAAAQVLTLEQAVQTAESRQPQLRQASAQAAAARARADEARAPLLPQVNGAASYQRATQNFSARARGFPSGFEFPAPSLHTYNNYSLALTANQLIWDFRQTSGRWRAAQATAQAQGDTERATQLQVVYNVRAAYFNARALKALLRVAREQLESQQRHFKQVEGFVQVGTRPEIDLAQARTDLANAQVQLINAENAYDIGKAQLNQAMGITGPTSYDVADETLPPVSGEDLGTAPLVAEALSTRPEVKSLDQQVRAQKLTLTSLRGSYWPSLGAAAGVTDNGSGWNDLIWNLSASVNLSWPLFEGLLRRAQVREGEATLTGLDAQQDSLTQQIWVEVDQARLGVRAAKAALTAAGEALANARVRLQLAEGRYQTGVGSIIELEDSQTALTSAAAQEVQAEYNLASARAALLRALGRR